MLIIFVCSVPTWVQAESPISEIVIIDDQDPGCRVDGPSWMKSPYGNPYAGWKHHSRTGIGNGLITWKFLLPDGHYRIEAFINTGDYTERACYSIRHADGETNVIRSQNHLDSGWLINLGEFRCGDSIEVHLSDDASHGIVIADAIRCIRVDTSMQTASPPVTEKHADEMRGVWVTRWNFKSPQDVARIMTQVAQAHFNTVFFQVRGRADAFYRSRLEPWAEELTGTLGHDPGWDPLEVAVLEAHRRGLEIHAWINTLTCWSGLVPPPRTSPRHLFLAHPEWLQTDRSGKAMPLNEHYVFLSPGNPAYRKHLLQVCTDIATRYAIDGIHFDYIRFAGRDFSNDAVTQKRYTRELSWMMGNSDWLRLSLNELVKSMYESLIRTRSNLKVTAAVWGIYRDLWQWNSSSGFDTYYQDSRTWLENGWIDAICPMIYWPIDNSKPPYFEQLANDFAQHRYGRHVYAGISSDFDRFSRIENMIRFTRACGLTGSVIFAYTFIEQHQYWNEFRDGPFRDPCRAPEMPWKTPFPHPLPNPEFLPDSP